MVSKNQRSARKRFREAHPELPQKPTVPTEPKTSKKKKQIQKKKKEKVQSDKGADNGLGKPRKSKVLRKHPLRVPGMKPGESCFICKSQDHIAKFCPSKAQWERKKICLLCRQRGHSLKHCPNNSGIHENKFCYNCGEVGHSLSKCPKPLQDGGTKFAECFLCNGHGHLSKNCPKNTHGIYPKGGSCKLCGGVTHLAKDCLSKHDKKPVEVAETEYPNASQQGKRKAFASGDDLDDEFALEEEKTKQKNSDKSSVVDTGPLGIKVEKSSNVKPKKDRSKIVNFTG
ncbi:uncharacterized protein C683.02c [Amborella trichopoda]|uniref:CCHC-type domain-containing protein n=1 Tax=Amborella trichopoda TaxID=13333 RepID=W1NH19_AMBTC|nr:uncharacterized protein C683.02c [Amborella trichopoda]ERM95097.1 hypothetical protein AMTR_s00009p00256060 [Amborella trichopoda]|eukprot:XP_006827681.1 uncharacterized protein C683.02c [Amborella trichopoda]